MVSPRQQGIQYAGNQDCVSLEESRKEERTPTRLWPSGASRTFPDPRAGQETEWTPVETPSATAMALTSSRAASDEASAGCPAGTTHHASKGRGTMDAVCS